MVCPDARVCSLIMSCLVWEGLHPAGSTWWVRPKGPGVLYELWLVNRLKRGEAFSQYHQVGPVWCVARRMCANNHCNSV